MALLLIAGATGVAAAAQLPPGGTFSDDNGNVHEGYIEAIAEAGVTQGCAPGLYCPSKSVTRGQMASFLARALSLPAASKDYFDDDTGNVHEDNINRIAEAGVTLGKAPGIYDPLGTVTRGQMASFLARGFDLPPSSRDYFPDDAGDVHEDNINRIAKAEITLGFPDGTYKPLLLVRRDQMASFIGRAMGLAPIVPPPPTTTTTTQPGTTTTTSATTTTTSSTTTTTVPASYDIVVSTSSDRSGAALIGGQTLSGDAFAFISPNTGIRDVEWYLDNPGMNGEPDQIENFSEYDLAGTAPNGSAQPYDTFQLDNGSHQVTAVVRKAGGGKDTITRSFTVNNPAAVVFRPNEIRFTVEENAADSAMVALDANTGAGAGFTVSDNRTWITVNPLGGTTSETITVDVDAAGLSVGVRSGTVTPSAAGFQGNPLTVRMNVINSGQCSPLDCADVLVSLPYTNGFTTERGNILDGNFLGTGFTKIATPGSSAGYVPENLALDLAQGIFSITTTSGLMFEDNNDQDNALAVGVDATTATVDVATTLVNPPTGTGAFEQAGLWFGNGQNNYVKVSTLSTPTGTKIELLKEQVGVATQSIKSGVLADLSSSVVELLLEANPTANTVQAWYRVNGGALVPLGQMTVVPEIFSNGSTVIDPAIGTNTFAGIFASHRNGPSPVVFNFTQFSAD